MRLKTFKIIVFLLLCMFFVDTVSGQSGSRNIRLQIPEIAILDIEPNTTNINLDFTAPGDAGEAVQNDSDNSKWLNYTSCLALGDPDRSINVSVDRVLQGIDLNLTVSNAAGGGGSLGTVSGSAITLSTISNTIINNIGGSYTGDGAFNGYQLEYSLDINDYSQLEEISNESVTVIFTISN